MNYTSIVKTSDNKVIRLSDVSAVELLSTYSYKVYLHGGMFFHILGGIEPDYYTFVDLLEKSNFPHEDT
jgi:hypothetical protein